MVLCTNYIVTLMLYQRLVGPHVWVAGLQSLILILFTLHCNYLLSKKFGLDKKKLLLLGRLNYLSYLFPVLDYFLARFNDYFLARFNNHFQLSLMIAFQLGVTITLQLGLMIIFQFGLIDCFLVQFNNCCSVQFNNCCFDEHNLSCNAAPAQR